MDRLGLLLQGEVAKATLAASLLSCWQARCLRSARRMRALLTCRATTLCRNRGIEFHCGLSRHQPLANARMVKVTDRNCERVRRVVWFGNRAQTAAAPLPSPDLALVCVAIARDRLFSPGAARIRQSPAPHSRRPGSATPTHLSKFRMTFD